MRKVLPYLTQGIVLCLCGCGFFYLLRKLSSVSLENSSEAFDENLKQLTSWQRRVESELESQFDRIRSIAGRVDRRQRKQEPTTDAPEEVPPGLPGAVPDMDQGALNRLLAQKFHG